jgi:hypothetical protein
MSLADGKHKISDPTGNQTMIIQPVSVALLAGLSKFPLQARGGQICSTMEPQQFTGCKKSGLNGIHASVDISHAPDVNLIW